MVGAPEFLIFFHASKLCCIVPLGGFISVNLRAAGAPRNSGGDEYELNRGLIALSYLFIGPRSDLWMWHFCGKQYRRGVAKIILEMLLFSPDDVFFCCFFSEELQLQF